MPTKRRTVPTRNRPKRNRPGGSGRSLPPASKRKGKTQRRELIFSCCSFKLPATKAAETAAVIFFFQHTTKKFDCPINTSAVLPKTYEKSPENRGFGAERGIRPPDVDINSFQVVGRVSPSVPDRLSLTPIFPPKTRFIEGFSPLYGKIARKLRETYEKQMGFFIPKRKRLPVHHRQKMKRKIIK